MTEKIILSPVKKIIIPAAGLGTRFLPMTKAMPKEMLPVVDKPIIQYVVEQAVASGIEDVIIVTGQNKRAIEDHFDSSSDLVEWLKKTGKESYAAEIQRITSMANFVYVRQKGPYGNGTPVLTASHLVGDQPFAVAFGDELYDCQVPLLQQLIDVFMKYDGPVLTGYQVDDEGTKKFGIIEGAEIEPGVTKMDSISEKPGPTATQSRLAALGVYILTPDIIEELSAVGPGRGGEIWLVDAIAALGKKRSIYAKKMEGVFHDTGSKLGWLRANIEMGLQHPEFGDPLRSIINQLR